MLSYKIGIVVDYNPVTREKWKFGSGRSRTEFCVKKTSTPIRVRVSFCDAFPLPTDFEFWRTEQRSLFEYQRRRDVRRPESHFEISPTVFRPAPPLHANRHHVTTDRFCANNTVCVGSRGGEEAESGYFDPRWREGGVRTNNAWGGNAIRTGW